MLRSQETMLGKFKVIDCFLLIYLFPSWTLRTSSLGCMFFDGTEKNKSVIVCGEPQVLMFHGEKWTCLWPTLSVTLKSVSLWVHTYILVISFNIILVLFWRCYKLLLSCVCIMDYDLQKALWCFPGGSQQLGDHWHCRWPYRLGCWSWWKKYNGNQPGIYVANGVVFRLVLDVH